MVSTPEDSVSFEDLGTRDGNATELAASKLRTFYERYPNLPDPFAALGVYLAKRIQSAREVAEGAGVVYLEYKDHEDSSIRMGVDRERAEDADRYHSAVIDDFRRFKQYVPNTGYVYKIGVNNSGRSLVHKMELKPRSRSGWDHLDQVDRLGTLLDYWNDQLVILDHQAVENPNDVNPILDVLLYN